MLEARIRLRIQGDDLEPDEITRQLCTEPTAAWRKGGEVPTLGKRTVYGTCGHWQLDATLPESASLSEQILDVLSRVSSNPEIWNDLKKRFEVDIDVGLFMYGSNEALWLSEEAVKLLAARDLGLDIEVYSFSGDASGRADSTSSE